MKYDGQIIPVLTAPPEWQSGIRARMQQETIIAEALSGTEDRRQRQARPLWSLRYGAATHTARETGYIRSVMLAAKEMPIAVPFWPQARRLTGAAATGVTTLAHDDTADLFLFRSGQYVLLMEHALRAEVVQLDIALDHTSQIVTPLASDWPADTTIVPLLVGHLPRPDTAHRTAEAGLWQVDFEERFLEVTS